MREFENPILNADSTFRSWRMESYELRKEAYVYERTAVLSSQR
jgi:hypothetical protein